MALSVKASGCAHWGEPPTCVRQVVMFAQCPELNTSFNHPAMSTEERSMCCKHPFTGGSIAVLDMVLEQSRLTVALEPGATHPVPQL